MPIFQAVIFLSALLLCAEHDFFFKTVPANYGIFLLAAGLPLTVARGVRIADFVVSALVYALCTLFWGFLSRFMGGADVKIIAVCLISAGVPNTLSALTTGIFAAGIFSFFYTLCALISNIKKRQDLKKETIPFVPFLFIGALITVCRLAL